ncbi:MAG: ATP synthase F0 subunit C [Candidatus Nanoperiomorbaceae bacterium]
MQQLAFALAYGIPALGATLGAGMIGMAALNSAGRNPEKISQLQTMMIVGISFIDALGIIGLIAAILSKVM